MKILLLFILLSLAACSKPFMVGKKHQLRLGIPKKTTTVVKIIEAELGYDSYISLVFVMNNDTLAYDMLSLHHFNKIFKPIK